MRIAFSLVIALLAAAPAAAQNVIVDGNVVNSPTITPIGIGNTVAGTLNRGDNIFYADPTWGALGYYEDLFALAITEKTAIDITMTASVAGEAWVDLFVFNGVTGEYDYFWSADTSATVTGEAKISGTIEPGLYLVGASTLNELVALDYTLSVAPFIGLDPLPIGGGSFGCVCGSDLCVCDILIVLYTLSADNAVPTFTVSEHSSATANQVVGFLRAVEKRHNGRFIGASLRPMLRANGTNK